MLWHMSVSFPFWLRDVLPCHFPSPGIPRLLPSGALKVARIISSFAGEAQPRSCPVSTLDRW